MASSCRFGGGINRITLSLPLLLLLLLLLLATAATPAGCAWVQDYASNQGCGETAAAELCDPGEPAANRACRDACHYSGCRGGSCVYLDVADATGGAARGCHCRGAG